MTSQTRSRTVYLIQTDNITVLLLHSRSILKSSVINGFSIRFNDISGVAYFLLGRPENAEHKLGEGCTAV